MKAQRHRVELNLVKAEDLEAELARRNQEAFTDAFNKLDPVAVDLHIWSGDGKMLTAPIIIAPSGRWYFA